MFVGRSDTAEELTGADSLIQLVFPEEDSTLYGHFLEHYPRRDEMEHIVAVENGIVVGYALIIPQTLIWNGVEVECDRIGFAATHPQYRGRGIMTSVMRKTVFCIRERGKPVSVIFGIPYIYRKFGYDYCIPDDSFGPFSTIPLSKIKGAGYPVQAPAPENVKRMLQLYKKHHGGASLYAHREVGDWYFQEAASSFKEGNETLLFMDKDKIKGYARVQKTDGSIIVRELAVEGLTKNENQNKVLAAIKAQAEGEQKEIRFAIPPSHPILKGVKRLGGVVREPHYGGYFRMESLKRLLGDLKEVMEDNLSKSSNKGYTGRVLLDAYDERAVLVFKNGKITNVDKNTEKSDTHIRIPPGLLLQLMTGYKTVKDVEDTCDLIASDEGKEILESLFFPGKPYISYRDRW